MFNKKWQNKRNFSSLEIEDYVLTATEKEAAKMEKHLNKKIVDILWFGMILCMTILAFRVVFLIVIKGSYYKDVARGNSVRSIVIKAPRGRILDRNGTVLVNNIPSIDAVIIPANIPKEGEERKIIAQKVAKILSMNEGEVTAKMQFNDQKSSNPVLLKEAISQDESLLLLEKGSDMPGISIEKTAIRQYVDGAIFSHILGYEGKIEQKEFETKKEAGYLLTDYIGKQGVEKTYEKYLRGENGANQVEVDSLGNTKREIGIINPKPGSDLVLSIDAALQKKLYDSMTAILEKTKTKTASAVAINPKNGQVLALVNVPSYDNNLFSQKISSEEYNALIQNPGKPLFNRAVLGEYPPGSTIKPGIAAAALSEGVITPTTIIDSLGGSLRIGNFSFNDWKVHGPSDVRTAIAESNDIFFYTIGGGYGNIQGLGMDRMKKYYNLFGLGNPTGIDLPSEASGLIPSEQWKKDKIGERWYVGDSYHCAIGQGFVTATPLQLANYTASIANNGTLYKPRIANQIKNNNGNIENVKSEVIRSDFISPEILKVAQEGMRQTVLAGTAQPLKELPVAVAAKTGTAQFGVGGKEAHGWLVTYAPYDDPQIAMVVLVEGGGEGFTSALPVTKEVYQWYFGGRQ
jgi:penicillin-binding protein 2